MNTATIISELKRVADPERKKAVKTMFPTSMEYLGVRTPAMRQLLKKWHNDVQNMPPEKLIAFSKQLVETQNFEANHVAFELLWQNKTALNQLNLSDLEYLGQNMDNWATTDSFSIMLSEWAWRNNQITDNNIIE